VFIGHGTGDKPYGGNLITADNLLNYDYIFLTGDKHLERLKAADLSIPEDKFIKIGNMNFDDYLNNKLNRDRILDHYKVKDREKPVVLYAPTWRFGKGTFKKYAKYFARTITKKYNLIIRPHYHDYKRIPAMKVWAKLNGLKNLYFSEILDFYNNDKMIDFAVSDILISDTSSVLYEYLVTRKPIIVIETGYRKLQKMPDSMNIMKHTDIYDGTVNINDLISENLESQKYHEDYEKMLFQCFYHNDGRSTERAVNFLKEIGDFQNV
jgi:CDP-glycerol glycerophosphotransferase (TagB/SpsB family)